MYRIEDIDKIKSNITDIQDLALLTYKKNYEPNLDENKEVYKLVIEFIKKKKRIIYGGFAQNHLIKIKNENDAFYREVDTPDIEFYSFEPIVDLIELCDFLKSKNLKYVEGTEGIHEGTYKIFVNFINYCDITYLPKNIYNGCRTIINNDLIFAHPYFLYIDFYRVFTDPLTSYWRLDKSFNRFLKLIKHYPILKVENNNILIQPTDSKILRFIRKHIIHDSKYIIIGKYAYNYFIKKMSDPVINIDFYEIITSNYEEDIIKILDILKTQYNTDFKEFTPFFEFFDKRIEFYINNKCVLKVYGNNDRCIVFKHSDKKKCNFGTFQIVVLYLLSNYNYNIINKNNKDAITCINLIYNIIQLRNKYLDKHNITVLDKSPFEEFIINCIGKPVDLIRESRINIKNKKKKGLKMKFKYEPGNIAGKIPNYNFENVSGNEILNKRKLNINN